MADSASWQAWGWLVARTTFIPHLDVMPQNPTIKNLLMKNEKTKRKRSGFKSEGSSSSNELETQNHATHRSGSLFLSLSLKFLHVHTLVGWCEAPPTKGEVRVKYYNYMHTPYSPNLFLLGSRFYVRCKWFRPKDNHVWCNPAIKVDLNFAFALGECMGGAEAPTHSPKKGWRKKPSRLDALEQTWHY